METNLANTTSNVFIFMFINISSNLNKLMSSVKKIWHKGRGNWISDPDAQISMNEQEPAMVAGPDWVMLPERAYPATKHQPDVSVKQVLSAKDCLSSGIASFDFEGNRVGRRFSNTMFLNNKLISLDRLHRQIHLVLF